jgi:hypothetical protein
MQPEFGGVACVARLEEARLPQEDQLLSRASRTPYFSPWFGSLVAGVRSRAGTDRDSINSSQEEESPAVPAVVGHCVFIFIIPIRMEMAEPGASC